MYQQEHDELFNSIRRGEPLNDGEWMAHSTLMAIMGRMSAYTGKEVTWEEALNSTTHWSRTISPGTCLPVRPLATPGQTKFA